MTDQALQSGPAAYTMLETHKTYLVATQNNKTHFQLNFNEIRILEKGNFIYKLTTRVWWSICI